MTGYTGIGFAPLVPWQGVAAIAVLALLLLVFGVVRGARGSIIRALAIAVLAGALLNPHLESENRKGEPDVAIVVLDDPYCESLRLLHPFWSQIGEVFQLVERQRIRTIAIVAPGGKARELGQPLDSKRKASEFFIRR